MQDPAQTDTNITAIFAKIVSHMLTQVLGGPPFAGHVCVLASAGTWQVIDCGMHLQMGGFNVLFCLQYTSSDVPISLRSIFVACMAQLDDHMIKT